MLLRFNSADLLSVVRVKSNRSGLEQEWLDVAVAEMMGYLLAGPAACRGADWHSWDDLPDHAQAILVGVLARHASMGQGTVAEERIGDYQVRYSDPALFEGRIPRYFNDGEELALAKIAGCSRSLYSVTVQGIPVHDMSSPERATGGGLEADSDWVVEEPSHANGWQTIKRPRSP